MRTFADKIAHALRIISAPTGTYDASTIEAAREILAAALHANGRVA